MHGSMDGRVDRAAMIEAASRSLRQQMQMGKARERPRSKGSNYDTHASVLDPRHSGSGGDPRTTGENRRGSGDPSGESRSSENAQRRIRSAENEHRSIREIGTRSVENDQHEGPPVAASQSLPSSALDHYPVEEESSPCDDVERDPDLRRPYSRKKDPSASAAAGLGAFSSPTKLTDAFEQRKMRQPIPVESWGPRPPSRGGIQSKATSLDVPEDRSSPIQRPNSTTGRSRAEANMSSMGMASTQAPTQIGGTWAEARSPGGRQSASGPHRGRERKAKERGSGGPEELGVFGSSTMFGSRSQSSQQLHKNIGPFESHPEIKALSRPSAFAPGAFGQGSGPWASRADTPSGALEISGLSLADTTPPWPSSPSGASASGASPPTRRASRNSEMVCVEDAEADTDLGAHASSSGAHAYRRDAVPAQVIITRSSQQKKERGDARRGSDDRTRDRGKSMPFDTGLDPDFLSLFAS